MTLNEEGQKAVARPRKKRYIVAAILLGLIAVYAILGAIFWKIGMPAFMFGYEKNDKGGITITDYLGPYLQVHIPDKIEGLEVTEIGHGSIGYELLPRSDFDEYICQNILEVRLPDTVEKIGYYAFGNCKKLTNINIPSSLRELETGAFAITRIKEIELPEGMTQIGDSAFLFSGNLKKITLPDSIEEIDTWAFHYCVSLKEINVPDGLKKIHSNVFGHTALTDEQKQAFYDKAEEVIED
ncbi:leucine-rich repeat domain-containing protein [Ruminococcus albus]|uniref:leucine-rich repeat domain-containing protein n=1 Tax=Ruminococcus albus TaxID=1264 RepID=UPI000464FF7E|nr:leucine-rich repeat domain-containing protein [Ruminococcus albus]